jgi:hypothetical protein
LHGLGIDTQAVGHDEVDVVSARIRVRVDQHPVRNRLVQAPIGLRQQIRMDGGTTDEASDVRLDRADRHRAHLRSSIGALPPSLLSQAPERICVWPHTDESVGNY